MAIKDQAYRYQRVSIWFVLALCYLLVYFHRVAINVVADYLMVDFAITGTVLGFLAAVYSNLYAVMQIPGGLLVDYWGPRRLVALGAILAGAGSIIFGIAPGIRVAFLGRILIGMGGSTMLISIFKYIANWYRADEFATMSGFTMLAGNMGGLLASSPFALAVEFTGWRLPFVAIGAINLLMAASAWLVTKDSPSEAGYQEAIPRSQTIAAEKNKLEDNLNNKSLLQVLLAVLKNPYTWPPFLAAFGIFGGYMTFSGTWGVPYLMQVYNLSRDQAAHYMFLFSLGMIVGSPLVGILSDRLRNRKKVYIFFALCYVLVWVALLFWNGGMPPLGAMPFLVLAMGFFGASQIMAFPCVKEVNHSSLAGTATAVANIGPFLSLSILQPLCGHVLESYWPGTYLNGAKIFPLIAYRSAFFLCFCFALLGLVAVLFIKETYCCNIYSSLARKSM